MIDINFKKKYGQNFLSDENLLKAIVKDADVKGKDVLEIGAGSGALTKFLSLEANKVISFEIDKELEDILNSQKLKNTTFLFEDALKEPTNKIDDLFESNFHLVANLPYYITTPLIFKFLEESQKISSLTIMVQKEVAERIVACPNSKDYGILTVMVAFYGSAKITRIVKRNMFTPMPNVDSAVVHISIDRNKYKDISPTSFSRFIKACFSMRRKTLANNLSSFYRLPKSALDVISEYKNKRSEDLTIDEFLHIYKQLYDLIK